MTLFTRMSAGYRFLSALAFIFTFWSLMITFSRGAWFGVLVGIVFFIFFYIRQKLFRITLVLLLILGSVLLFVKMFSHQSLSYQIERHDSAKWRVDIWQESIGMIEDRPLFGHGINTYMKLFQQYRTDKTQPTYAHNCYIQMAT